MKSQKILKNIDKNHLIVSDPNSKQTEYKYIEIEVFKKMHHTIWVKNILVLDLGKSYTYSEPVWNLIKERLHISAYFGLISFILSYMVCIPLGIFKAVKHGSKFDKISDI